MIGWWIRHDGCMIRRDGMQVLQTRYTGWYQRVRAGEGVDARRVDSRHETQHRVQDGTKACSIMRITAILWATEQPDGTRNEPGRETLDHLLFAISRAAFIRGESVRSGSQSLKNGCCKMKRVSPTILKQKILLTCNNSLAVGRFSASTSRVFAR